MPALRWSPLIFIFRGAKNGTWRSRARPSPGRSCTACSTGFSVCRCSTDWSSNICSADASRTASKRKSVELSMCGELEEEADTGDEVYSRFAAHANSFLAGMKRERRKPDPVHAHLDRLFRELLSAAADENRAP